MNAYSRHVGLVAAEDDPRVAAPLVVAAGLEDERPGLAAAAGSAVDRDVGGAREEDLLRAGLGGR